MLRAKQLSTLSQSARPFFLGGSRCTADGSSCNCSEDEKDTKDKVHHVQTSSTLVSKTSTRVGPHISADAVKVNSHRAECARNPTSLPQVISSTGSLGRANCINYADSIDAIHNEMVHSPPVAGQFVKAGMVAANFFSDLVNYKIPISDESGLHASSKSCMVDRVRPLSNIKSSNVKTFRKEKVHGNPSAEITAQSKLTGNSYGTKGRGEKSGSVKHLNALSETCDGERYVPRRSKAYSNCSLSNVQYSEENYNGIVTKNFKKLPRGTNMRTGVSLTANHSVNAGHVVENVSHILQQSKWGPQTEEALRKLKCSMDTYQANQILKQIHDHSVALGLFYWLKQQPGFRHDEHTYTTMVGILGRARQFGMINKLLNQMIQDGCQPNVVTYNRLIHSYGRANYLSAAVDVFNEMQEIGCEPDRVTYCTLIDIHAKAGYLDFAMEMYQRMQKAGLSPDTFTYSVIINCLGKAGHLAAAHKLFCEMVDQGCIPNLVTYNIMIALEAKARNYPHALKLYRDMQSAGFEPDKVSYSIVMEVLGHCGYLEEAEAVFTEMKRKNWVPDEPVYGLLVDLWGKAGNVEKAWGWYQAMLNAGLCPNVPTCNSLLSAFLRVHHLSDAYGLLQSMLSLGLIPSLQTYTLLLSCCTEAQTSFDLGFCCELMAVTGHPAHMFLLSMPAAGPDGQNVRDHASNFLNLMHSEDRESKRGLVDAVVDFLHKSGLKEEAGSVWEVAVQKNVYPDAVREKSSSYWLINLHVMSDGTAVTALSRTLAWFRRQMLASGICPSRIDIVTGWGRRSRVTGSSLVRQAVQELLHNFSFPFFTDNGNSGCFVGCGEPLSRWLLPSYVERMHLL